MSFVFVEILGFYEDVGFVDFFCNTYFLHSTGPSIKINLLFKRAWRIRSAYNRFDSRCNLVLFWNLSIDE